MSEDELDERLSAWLRALPGLTHYEVLGVDGNSDFDISAAFHAFSERFHPDRIALGSPNALSAARKIYQRGAEAYRVLRDPNARAAYDLALARTNSANQSDRGTAEARSLEDLCATKGGRLHARQAERALGEGDLRGAQELIEKALRAEGANEGLRDRLEAVKTLLFLRG